MSQNTNASISFIKSGSYYETYGGTPKEIPFDKINDQYKKILPIFGAHPLTAVYCENPILLLEGEDDVRVWQQVVRSSQSKIKLTPVGCESIDKLKEFEDIANNILSAVYGKEAKGYSLRDGDEHIGDPLNDESQIIRIRLNCYAIENCILSDDVLSFLGTKWEAMKGLIDEKLSTADESKQNRKDYKELFGFKENGYDRKGYKIKDSRNALISLLDTIKPWEVIVGQAIKNMVLNSAQCDKGSDSLYNYLGKKLFDNLISLNQ